MTKQEQIWVVDDDRSIRWVLEKALHQAHMEVTTFESASGLRELLTKTRPDAIVTDIRMPGTDGLQLLSYINAEYPDLPVIVMTAHADLGSAVSAFEGGAFEYMPKPFDINEAVDIVRRAVEQHQRKQKSHVTPPPAAAPEIIGAAPAMQEVFRAIGRLSKSNITVLINGESGTGKELVAHALHRHSPRATKPFIALNTAAIPRELLESELFGHEKGAFTGAQATRYGRFEQADSGTLFLDEIGDMPAELQTRLLRVLSDGEFYRVGGHVPIKVDVRIIAATHQDLEARVANNQFREDLFHRLNVIRIHIPSLRNRREDIPLLLKYFLRQAAQELNSEVKTLKPEVEKFLSRLDWPGNVRQLENSCRWLTVMAAGHEVHMEDLPPELKPNSAKLSDSASWESALARWADQRLAQGETDLLNSATPAFERVMIEAALKQTGGRRQDAAKLLGWGRNTLTRKIKELGMGDDDAGEDE